MHNFDNNGRKKKCGSGSQDCHKNPPRKNLGFGYSSVCGRGRTWCQSAEWEGGQGPREGSVSRAPANSTSCGLHMAQERWGRPHLRDTVSGPSKWKDGTDSDYGARARAVGQQVVPGRKGRARRRRGGDRAGDSAAAGAAGEEGRLRGVIWLRVAGPAPRGGYG